MEFPKNTPGLRPEPRVPEDRFYDRDHHVWVRSHDGRGHFLLGLDSLGLEALGELAYVSLPAPGAAVRRGEALGSIEAAKMTSTLVSPVSGTVVSRNEAVVRDPLLINRDPYGSGWLVVLDAPSWEDEKGTLVSGPAVRAWAEREMERLRSERRLEP